MVLGAVEGLKKRFLAVDDDGDVVFACVFKKRHFFFIEGELLDGR